MILFQRLMSPAASTSRRGDTDRAKNRAGVAAPGRPSMNAAKLLMKHEQLGSFQFSQNQIFNSLLGHKFILTAEPVCPRVTLKLDRQLFTMLMPSN